MNSQKAQYSHYLTLSYNFLFTNDVLHYILFLFDICLLLLQILEIYYNNFEQLTSGKDIKYFSFISYSMHKINNLKTIIAFLIYVIIIIIKTIFSFILNNFNITLNKFWAVIINFTELIFNRLDILFMFHYLFFFTDIYLIVGIIITIPFLLSLISSISVNHLFIFFFSFVKYPYDAFSAIIDLFLLSVKIFISISSTTRIKNLSKFFFILSLFILLYLQIYLTYLMVKKSYYLMNNVSLNKARYSFLLSNLLVILLILISNHSEISNTYIILCFANIFILCLILVFAFYDPYQYIKFEKDDNEENVYFYFFVLDRKKNKNLILEKKLEEHKSLCGRCNLCKKLDESKVNDKFENIDLYYIIYNSNNQVLNLMNKIIRELRKYGKDNFSANSNFLINLMYIYSIGLIKKDLCFFLNTELIFRLLISDNKEKLEDNRLYLNKIKYVNNYVLKANEIIDTFYKIFDEKKLEKKYEIVFKFGTLIEKLNYKEIKNNNINNNNSNNINNKHLNCSNLITICSIFYEELYNESLSNSRIYIRDSQNLLEDLINNNYKNQKIISLEIDLQNFKVKIIRAGGHINKYENNYLFDLFPEIFKNKQILTFKKILLNSNFDIQNYSKNSNKENFSKNKKNEEQYINFCLLIEEKEDNNAYYQLLKLELNLVILKDIDSILFLNGIYKIDKDIIITEKNKDKEYLFHFGNKEQINLISFDNSKENRIPIKQIKGSKYLGSKKLVQDLNALKECERYKVYHFLLPSKKNIYSKKIIQGVNDINLIPNDISDNKQNDTDSNNKIFFNDVASQSSSVSSTLSRNNFMMNNRGNKQSQNEDDISKSFKNSKYILWVSIFILFAAFIIEYIILKLYNSNLYQKVNFYLNLLDYYKIFNRLYCSILSLSCIGKSPDTTECTRFLGDYVYNKIEENFNNLDLTQEGIKSWEISKEILFSLFEENFVDFEELLFNQQKILVDSLELQKENIADYLAQITDSEFTKYFDDNIIHYKISQNFENNELNLSFKTESITFIDALLLITSRCGILSKEISDLKYPIYILNKLGQENSLQNINKDNKLNPYQENFYLLILDDGAFFVKLNDTIYKIEDLISRKFNRFKFNVILTMSINAFLYLVIFFFIFYYICVHIIIIFQILKEVYEFLNEKLNEIPIKDIMRKKIDNLKLILSFYEKDINTTINELNSVYNNYKKNYNLKIKEESRLVKKENKIEKDIKKNNNLNFFKLFNFKYFRRFFAYSTKKNTYFYSILFNAIFIILLFGLYLLLWLSYFSRQYKAIGYINIARELSKASNDIIANFLIMIHSNQTFEQVSSHLDNKDFTSFMYFKLTDLYEAKGYIDSIQDLLTYKQENFIFNCELFYKNLDNPIFTSLLSMYESNSNLTKFYNTMAYFCEASNVMAYKNYKTVYMQFFNPIETMMQNFKEENYSVIFNYIKDNNIEEIEILFFIIHIYFLDVMNTNVNDIFILLLKKINNNIDLTGIIFIVAVIHLVISLFFIFKINMNKDCHNFITMKKIFKVCNISE